jgi:glycosyltransferase involved in cell wall biosynthesis
MLRETMRSLCSVAAPANQDWELVVVNNNCTDDTDSVLELFEDKLPLRRIHEPRAGLSNARNAAVAAARGQYVLFTDDDVNFSPRWLVAYAEAIARRPSASVFGGPIVPLFEGGAPEWLKRAMPNIGTAYGLRDLGAQPFPFSAEDSGRLPFGANYCVSIEAQVRFPYDPRLGRRANAPLIGGEEIAVLQGILNSGGEGWWVPDAYIEHRVPRNRQTVRFLRRYFEGQGMNTAMSEACAPPLLFGKPRSLVRQAIRFELAYLVKRAFGAPELWAPALVRASEARGRLKAASSLSLA